MRTYIFSLVVACINLYSVEKTALIFFGIMSSFEFSETKRGQPLLIYEGRAYTLKRVLKNMNKKWICRDAKCKGTLLTSENNVIEEGAHTCIPDVTKIEIEKCVVKCRKEHEKS